MWIVRSPQKLRNIFEVCRNYLGIPDTANYSLTHQKFNKSDNTDLMISIEKVGIILSPRNEEGIVGYRVEI